MANEKKEVVKESKKEEVMKFEELIIYGKAKVVHLAVGVDLLGSKTSLQAARGNSVLVTNVGIMAVSGKNGRKILIPFPNVKAVELE